VAPPVVRVGDLALVPLSSPGLVAVLQETLVSKESTPSVWEASSAKGTSLGAVSVEVDGAAPPPPSKQ
jgi:hypothetical protein